MNLIHLAEDKDCQQAVMNRVMGILVFVKGGSFIDYLNAYQLLKGTSSAWIGFVVFCACHVSGKTI